MKRGRLIAFEGAEGCGKTTQAARLAQAIGAVLTREPGGTPLGVRLRELVLERGSPQVHPRAEALLMAADRAQHVAEVLAPALARGDDVVTDRFSGSSLAYQGYGRGLDVGRLAEISAWAADGLQADLIVLLDVPADTRRARMGTELDRFETEADDFHRRVAEGYRALAAADPDRWAVIDGSGTQAVVAERVREAFDTWAARHRPPSTGAAP